MANKAAEDAQAGRSPAQRAGAAARPGDVADVQPDPGPAELEGDVEPAAEPVDPSMVAATVERGSGAIPYKIDGVTVTRQEYVDHVAAQEREQALADLAAAQHGLPQSTSEGE